MTKKEETIKLEWHLGKLSILPQNYLSPLWNPTIRQHCALARPPPRTSSTKRCPTPLTCSRASIALANTPTFLPIATPKKYCVFFWGVLDCRDSLLIEGRLAFMVSLVWEVFENLDRDFCEASCVRQPSGETGCVNLDSRFMFGRYILNISIKICHMSWHF